MYSPKTTALLVVSALSLVVVLALGLRHRDAIAKLSDAQDKIDFPYVGMYVPIAQAMGDGASVAIGEPSTAEVLYFYNTSCPFCRQSVPAIRRLAQSISTSRSSAVFMALSRDDLDTTKAYLEKQGLALPPYSLVDPRTIALFHAQYVPNIIVVSSEGKVVYARTGPLGEQEIAQVLAAVDAVEAEQRPIRR